MKFDSELERQVLEILTEAGVEIERGSQKLLGRPDCRIIGTNKLIFVHGCYWHRHSCTKGQQLPKKNLMYWIGVFSSRVNRDREVRNGLIEQGWSVRTIWECEIEAFKSWAVVDRLAA